MSKVDEILQDIEDYCVVGALGGTPFNTPEENDKLREDAIDSGRTKAKQALTNEITRARWEEIQGVLGLIEDKVGEEDMYQLLINREHELKSELEGEKE